MSDGEKENGNLKIRSTKHEARNFLINQTI